MPEGRARGLTWIKTPAARRSTIERLLVFGGTAEVRKGRWLPAAFFRH